MWHTYLLLFFVDCNELVSYLILFLYFLFKQHKNDSHEFNFFNTSIVYIKLYITYMLFLDVYMTLYYGFFSLDSTMFKPFVKNVYMFSISKENKWYHLLEWLIIITSGFICFLPFDSFKFWFHNLSYTNTFFLIFFFVFHRWN